MTEESLFHDALSRPLAERAEFLAVACASRPDLRAGVESLLAAHEQSGELLTADSTRLTANEDTLAADVPGGEPVAGGGEPVPLGQYRLLKVLGQGGMGVVYEAEDTHLQRRVAVKLMLPHLALEPSARQRFLTEARAAARVTDPHVVTVYQIGEAGGAVFVAMELLHGETLDERLRRDPTVPAAEIARIGREIATGLHAAHTQGVIHRDIKPANMILEAGSGRVKLLDFGLARAVSSDPHITRTGAVVGTPAYMSPEQAASGAVDHRADLFSLGAVLYRMATGQLPFPGATAMSVLSSLANDTPTPPHAVNPAVPRPLSDLIVRLLAKTPADRPATAAAVIDELRRIEATGPATAPAPKRRRWWPVAAVAASLLLVGGLVFAGWQLVQVKDKDGKVIAQVTVPDGGKVEVVDDKGKPVEVPPKPTAPEKKDPPKVDPPAPKPTAAAERKAVQAVMRLGGLVYLNGNQIEKPDDVPAEFGTDDRLALQFREVKEFLEADIVELSALPNGVEQVSFANSPGCTDAVFARITGFRGLKLLRMLGLYSVPVSDDGLKVVAKLRGLTSVTAVNTAATGTWMAELRDLPRLSFIEVGGKSLTKEGVAALAGVKCTYLHLGQCEVGDDAVAVIAQMEGVTQLQLCALMTDAGFAHLPKLTTLRSLDIGFTLEEVNLTDKSLPALAKLTELTHFQVFRAKFSNELLVTLKGLPKLKTLRVCGLNGVRDDGFTHVKGFPALEQLVVEQLQNVTDDALDALAGCNGLKSLNLQGMDHLSDAAARRLAAALPKCDVTRDGKPVPPKK